MVDAINSNGGKGFDKEGKRASVACVTHSAQSCKAGPDLVWHIPVVAGCHPSIKQTIYVTTAGSVVCVLTVDCNRRLCRYRSHSHNQNNHSSQCCMGSFVDFSPSRLNRHLKGFRPRASLL